MIKTPLKFTITIVLTLGLSMSFQSLLASWTPPSAPPPDNNVSEPINAGLGYQEKLGSLDIAIDFGVGRDLTTLGNFVLGGTMTSGTVPWARLSDHPYINVGPGISGGGSLITDRTLSLDTDFTNNMYVNRAGDAMTGNLILGGGNRSVTANAGTATFGSTASHTYIRSGNTSSNIYLQTGTSNRLTVLGNGNVGIGTTDPTQSLDVNGNIRTSSQVRANEYCDQSGGNCKAITGMGGRNDYIEGSCSNGNTCIIGSVSEWQYCAMSGYYYPRDGRARGRIFMSGGNWVARSYCDRGCANFWWSCFK